MSQTPSDPKSTVRRVSRPFTRKKAKSSPKRWGRKTFFALSFLAVESVVALCMVVGLVLFYRYAKQLPDVGVLVNDVRMPEPTTIWSSDGVLLGTLQGRNKVPVTLADISVDVQNATIAIEDHRFYSHFGIDPKGILRAAYTDVVGGNMTGQGASTLTQQLVRNVSSFDIGRQKLYTRKLREALVAIRMEQIYSKHQILSMYLNNVYYGAGAYGVEAASETYFGIPASKLDLAQAALLAGLPQRPTDLSPFTHLHRSIVRQHEVLDAMRKYGYISDQQYEDAEAAHLHFVKPKQEKNDFKAPYFVWYILSDLFHKYGERFVYSGLKIQTTLNWKMQQYADQAVRDGLRSAAYTGANQSCLICLGNHNGYIRAMVGGRDFSKSQFNITTDGLRPPGSTFKLFDYATAFDTGACNINTRFVDKPIEYPDSKGKWVHDFEGYSYQDLTCRRAIAKSVNTIAVQVAALVGIRKVIAYAYNMGIHTPLAPYLPTSIGATAVRPIDLCEAYSIVANGGVKNTPMGIEYITDANGNTIEDDQPQSTPDILQQSTISQLNEAFKAVVDYGTGTAARGDASSGIVHGARGKTGTSQDFRDAWFAGYTPNLTTVVWSADVHNKTYRPLRNNGQGGTVSAPIWHNFMIKADPLEQQILAVRASRTVPQQPPTGEKSQNPAAASAASAAAKKAAAASKSVTPANAGSADNQQFPASTSTGQSSPTVQPPSALSTGNGSAPVQPGTSRSDNTPSSNSVSPSTSQNPAASTTASTSPAVAPIRIAKPEHRQKMVTVLECAETHLKATMWCPVTIKVRMTAAAAAKLGYCTKHHAPPGAG